MWESGIKRLYQITYIKQDNLQFKSYKTLAYRFTFLVHLPFIEILFR